jgi:hypothetical protein
MTGSVAGIARPSANAYGETGNIARYRQAAARNSI